MSEIRVPSSLPDTHFPVNRSTEISLKIKMFGERRLRKLKRGALCFICVVASTVFFPFFF